jgi:hypothetical protein
MQPVELLYLFIGRKIATTYVIYPRTYSSSLLVGQPVNTRATRFDFAGDIGEFFLILDWPGLNLFQKCFCSGTHKSHSTFAGTGCSGDAFATRAAFAMPANAAIFFCGSEPGCTTPADMIRVAASSALISISMILLLGT